MSGDLIILDRGFRDCIKNLNKEYGIKCHMPTFSNDEANNTRFVTKLRWVVEAVNGAFKNSFQALDFIRNSMLNPSQSTTTTDTHDD